MNRFLEELKNTPGLENSAVSDGVPLGGNQSRSPYARVDGNPPPVNQRPLGLTRSISPGFLKTFGIPLLAGRDFDERDALDKPLVVVVSKSTANKLFPGGEDPIGKRIFFGTDNNTVCPARIVGVVGTSVPSSWTRRTTSSSPALGATLVCVSDRNGQERGETGGRGGFGPERFEQGRPGVAHHSTHHDERGD